DLPVAGPYDHEAVGRARRREHLARHFRHPGLLARLGVAGDDLRFRGADVDLAFADPGPARDTALLVPLLPHDLAGAGRDRDHAAVAIRGEDELAVRRGQELEVEILAALAEASGPQLRDADLRLEVLGERGRGVRVLLLVVVLEPADG